jgi:uncharacterized protein YbjT (DUF2867 family)
MAEPSPRFEDGTSRARHPSREEKEEKRMSTLILGGTGTVGSGVLSGLLERGEGGLRVMTRSAEKAGDLPDGVEGVVADLTDPLTLEGAFDGVERLFLLNPVAMTELHEGLSALEGARRAGVGKIVYLSVHNPENGPHVPHFASRIVIERAIRESGVPFVFIQPNNFFQNDFWLKDAILDYGVYPQPLGDRGIHRVDVRDVAEACATALTSADFDGRAVPLVGPGLLSGPDCARAWSEALGKEVQYGGHDLVAWETQTRQFMPAWMVYDFRMMYEMFLGGGFEASEADRNATREILGRAPRPFSDFTREVAGMWT